MTDLNQIKRDLREGIWKEILDGTTWAIKHLQKQADRISNTRWSKKDKLAAKALITQYNQIRELAEIGRLMLELQKYEVDIKPRGYGWMIGKPGIYESNLLSGLQFAMSKITPEEYEAAYRRFELLEENIDRQDLMNEDIIHPTETPL